jgi:hypothetical protein
MIKDARGAKISLVLADVDGTLVTAEKVLTGAPQSRWSRSAHRASGLR